MGKRLLDASVGTVLAVLAIPLILALALMSAATFRAWPFFTQTRVGRRGKPFRILKIRTLPRTAPAYAEKSEVSQLTLPRVATLLRSSHLDELPQLLLVPLGKMSLVGPRPEMEFLHAEADTGFAELRTSVRPGCTGLWQISRAANGMIWEAPEYDRIYLLHASIRFDLWILARTLFVISPRARYVSLDTLPRWAVGGVAARRRSVGIPSALRGFRLVPRVFSRSYEGRLDDSLPTPRLEPATSTAPDAVHLVAAGAAADGAVIEVEPEAQLVENVVIAPQPHGPTVA